MTMTATTRRIWIHMASPHQQVDEDVDRVQHGLALRLRVVGVEQLDRVLAPRQPRAAELAARSRWRGPCGPARGRCGAAASARITRSPLCASVSRSPVVRLVTHTAVFRTTCLSQPGLVRSSRKREPKTIATSSRSARSSIAHRVLDAVLAVGVERDDVAGAGLRRRRSRMPVCRAAPWPRLTGCRSTRAPAAAADGGGAVGAAVVDAHDVVEVLAELCDDVGR